MAKSLITLFFTFLIIKGILNDSLEPLYLTISKNMKNEVSKKGSAIFRVARNSKFVDKTDFERKILFKKTILNENNKSYEIGCGFWVNLAIYYVFCEFDETIPKGKYTFKFNKNNEFNEFNDKFNYLKYEIYIFSDEVFTVTKLDSDAVNLYSGQQEINVVDSKDIYELKFKVKSYNQEILLLSYVYHEPLNCKTNNEEMTCQIKRADLECLAYQTILNARRTLFFLNERGAKEALYLVPPIKISYNVQKIDVYVKITKLLSNDVEINNYIAYESNVTNIPAVMTSNFNLDFIGSKELSLQCFLRKGNNGPLLLLCETNKQEKELLLKEIENVYLLKDINIKYNFILLPVNINQKIQVLDDTNSYSYISYFYPNILNFELKNSFEIDLIMLYPEKVNGITFNEDAEDLKCENFIEKKRCIVPKEHFKGKKDGYYYIKYDNLLLNKKFSSFMSNPMTIIVSKKEEETDKETKTDNGINTDIETDKKINTDNSSSNTILAVSIIGPALIVVIAIVLIYLLVHKRKNTDLKEEVLNSQFKELQSS